MAYSKQTSVSTNLTDRVRARLGDPHYSVSHDEQHEDRFGYESELFLPRWSGLARMSVFIVGVFGLALSTQTRGLFRKSLGLFGLASLIRSITNLHVTDLIGWIANPSIRLKRAIRVNAPIDDVYDFLSQFMNYPRFMSYVQNVEVNDHGGLRWTMQGPAGLTFHWNTSLGKMILNQAISWKSSLNSLIRNSGDIRLTELTDESTEVHITLTFAPPVGALGYAVVHILGFDPKEKIDEDLQVLKAILEKHSLSNQEIKEFHRA